MDGRIVGSLLLLLTVLLVPEAWGATRYVSKSGTDNPTCTQATPCRSVQHAVNIASAGDTISIGKGKFAEDFGVTINKHLTINGSGIFSTRVNGGWSSVFHINSGATVTISDLDVMGGNNATNLAVGNTGSGGGISNHGHLTLHRVRVWKNSAQHHGGGIMNWTDGVLLISRSEIARNFASDGGGGLHNQGIAELNEIRIAKNYADTGSGGITNTGGGYAVVDRSEISYNEGTGIVNWASTMFLSNTTISKNDDLGVSTGGGGYTKLIHVTVAENGKGPDQTPYSINGGLQGEEGSDVELVNTIVANNTPVQCIFPPTHGPGSLNSLASDYTCLMWPGDGNLPGVDPKLGPLTWNGGLTFTHALKKGSPATDAVPANDDGCHPVDQRGVLRPIDGNLDGTANCDIGAFEYAPLKKWKNLEQ